MVQTVAKIDCIEQYVENINRIHFLNLAMKINKTLGIDLIIVLGKQNKK